jgi:xylulokinase
VYGIVDKPTYDEKSRVNTFVHVNHTKDENRYGVLLCLNGTGILNRWLKQMMIDPTSGKPLSYEQMNRLADDVSIGAEGITVLPFGNGAERILENANPGASVHGLNFNIHNQAHLVRAGQEGIVFALNYGLEIMRNMGLSIETVKAGFANMFLSPLFQNCFATVTNTSVHLYNTDGSLGAARGAGIGAGIYAGAEEAFAGLESRKIIEPDSSIASRYEDAYGAWRRKLEQTGAV